ncbi:LysM domain-containing protein [Colletotrichum orchidophilum]|uniref:LysM domain-containing protein n=1 Tax=Colletotrichum orchidophilum TaxID=1209926 RepID=A0A1G4B0D9_9PEZI|nr:LysM domain-containing protein [Colletotrichum orchidophilum]OHE94890.1 LysM domain-containing protein [Colletotrichum orchidophilum]
MNLLDHRVTSEFLPDSDHSDYLVAGFQDIQSVCQTSVGPLASRVVPLYPYATELYDTAPGPTSTSEVDTAPWIPGPDDHPNFNVKPPEELLDKNDAEPLPDQEPFVPPPAQHVLSTSDPPAGRASMPATCWYNVAFLRLCPVTVTQLILTGNQYICISRPGSSWVRHPDEDLPENSNGSIPGGPGSTEHLPIIDDPADVPTGRVQEGIAADCSRYIKAEITTASCWKIANEAQSRFFESIPVLGASGEHCASQILFGYYCCVGTEGDSTGTPNPTITQSAPAATSTSPSVLKPAPQREGTISTCKKWLQAVLGSWCWQLATDAGIDTSLFYQYNPVLSVDAPPAKPTATQAGIPANCCKFVEALAGSSCWQLANDDGIDMSVLFALNPVLGSQGENCGTQIWPNYFYCIATN